MNLQYSKVIIAETNIAMAMEFVLQLLGLVIRLHTLVWSLKNASVTMVGSVLLASNRQCLR